jgi:hypothetical protein
MKFNCVDCGAEMETAVCCSPDYPEWHPKLCSNCNRKTEWTRNVTAEHHNMLDGAYYGIRAAKDLGIFTEEFRKRVEELIDEEIEYYFQHREEFEGD